MQREPGRDDEVLFDKHIVAGLRNSLLTSDKER